MDGIKALNKVFDELDIDDSEIYECYDDVFKELRVLKTLSKLKPFLSLHISNVGEELKYFLIVNCETEKIFLEIKDFEHKSIKRWLGEKN